MEKMKRTACAIFAGVLLAFSVPALAQDNDRDRDKDDNRDRIEVNSDRDDRYSTIEGDRREDIDDREARNDQDDDNDGGNWGWVGLIGLAGLLGLRRNHDRVHTTTHRPVGSTGTGSGYSGSTTGGTTNVGNTTSGLSDHRRTGDTNDRTGSGSGTIITP
jgi:MYXO-CTERM domain-containing protein